MKYPPISKHLAAALVYGRAGLFVFPILEGTKDQPLIKQWGIRASCDAKQIAEWWTRWPDANIGLACMKSGISVVDSDVKSDGTGEQTLQALADLEGKVLSPTMMARSPRGGIHRFYKGRVATTVGKLGKHLDTRGVGSGNGGYVLLTPSRTKDGSYKWIGKPVWSNKAPMMAQIDPWVVEACGESVDNGPASQVPVTEQDTRDIVASARFYLTKDAPVSKQGAGGDDLLVKRVVPTLKDMGVSEELAGELLVDTGWNDRCEPPWQLGDCDDKDNLYKKVHNGYIYCVQNPPGINTPKAAFRDHPIDAAALDALVEWWKEFDSRPRPIRERKAVNDGLIETGRRSRGSDPLPIVRKVS